MKEEYGYPDTESDRIVPLGVMARLVHVSTGWLWAEAEAGHIPAIRAGDRFVFRPDVVSRIIADRSDSQKCKGECGRATINKHGYCTKCWETKILKYDTGKYHGKSGTDKA